MLKLPFNSEPSYTFSVPLEAGESYTFAVKFNDMSQSWVFDLTRDRDQAGLLASVPLLMGQDVLRPYALGIGGIVPMADVPHSLDAGPDDLGERVTVAWFSEAELAQLRAAGFNP